MKISDLGKPLRRMFPGSGDDLGFGTQMTSSGQRLINRDGSYNIRRKGLFTWTPYQSLVEMSWPRFLLLVLLYYLLVNALFAFIFTWLGVEQLDGLVPGTFFQDFSHAFFFSIQTFTTVGYGAINPIGTGANFLASLDALVGLMSFALVTGLLFARFSLPRAQILFSRWALIAPYRGGESFQFRIANKRNNKIINLEAEVIMSWVEKTGGSRKRRFATLPLERNHVALFPLNWTIVHPIDDSSPLSNLDSRMIIDLQTEFIVLIKGYDETFAQDVHINGSYTCREIVWGASFRPMYFSRRGHTVLDLSRISEYGEMQQTAPEEEE
ncbi:MAG: ion channel [Saprospiraceae bacterium]|nr:ion channel [Saprospiraceae bacterium]